MDPTPAQQILSWSMGTGNGSMYYAKSLAKVSQTSGHALLDRFRSRLPFMKTGKTSALK